MVPKKDFLAFLETFCRPIKGNVFIQYFQLYFSKKRVSEPNRYIYVEKKCTSFKADSQNVFWFCVSFVFSNFVITLLAHGYGPVL